VAEVIETTNAVEAATLVEVNPGEIAVGLGAATSSLAEAGVLVFDCAYFANASISNPLICYTCTIVTALAEIVLEKNRLLGLSHTLAVLSCKYDSCHHLTRILATHQALLRIPNRPVP